MKIIITQQKILALIGILILIGINIPGIVMGPFSNTAWGLINAISSVGIGIPIVVGMIWILGCLLDGDIVLFKPKTITLSLPKVKPKKEIKVLTESKTNEELIQIGKMCLDFDLSNEDEQEALIKRVKEVQKLNA